MCSVKFGYIYGWLMVVNYVLHGAVNPICMSNVEAAAITALHFVYSSFVIIIVPLEVFSDCVVCFVGCFVL
jgi:hypothetical protein